MSEPKPMAKLMRTLFLLLLGTVVLASAAAAADVRALLSLRDGQVSWAQLEQAAGGSDALVSELLRLREDTTRPFVGVRAERLLLRFTASPKVAEAIAQDLAQSTHGPRIRAVAAHLDEVPEDALQVELAKTLLDRASRETRMRPNARLLRFSKSERVRIEAKRLASR